MRVSFERFKDSKSNNPVLDYCRELLKEGIDPNTRLEVWDDNYDEPRLVITNIGIGASLEVSKEKFRFRMPKKASHSLTDGKDWYAW